MQKKTLIINGLPRTLIVDLEASLASVLREQLLLTGCKVGCNQGQCGTCSIIMDGRVIRSCVTKMKKVPDEANITTIEGLATPTNLHPLQVAWDGPMAALNAVSAVRDLFCQRKYCLMRIPAPLEKIFAHGSKNTAMPAVAQDTNR